MAARLLLVLLFLFYALGSAVALASSGDPDKGKETFRNKGCAICHSIDRAGGTVGPDLTQVTVRRSEERLMDWLKDPSALLKDTDMPKVPWKDEREILDLLAYFKTVRKEVNRDFLGKVPEKEAGKRLVNEYDCRACHRIIEPESGRERFPELTHIGSRKSKAWLDRWLKDPQSIKPGTFMPAFPFSDEERAAIVEYLITLK